MPIDYRYELYRAPYWGEHGEPPYRWFLYRDDDTLMGVWIRWEDAKLAVFGP